MYIRSQKKGVSLVMVLIFMMVATIAATATYKWLSSVGFTSADRLAIAEAKESSRAGLAAVRSWMTYHANDVGAVIRQYYDGGKKPVNLNDVIHMESAKQHASVWLTGVEAKEAKKYMYKFTIASTGYSRADVKYTEVSVLNVRGLYKIKVPVTFKHKSVPYDYSYFGGSTKGAQGTKNESMLINGNWEGNPSRIDKDFVVTGDVKLSGDSIVLGKNSCIGGDFNPENRGATATNIFVSGSTGKFSGTISGNAYFNGDFRRAETGDFYAKDLTIKGNFTSADAMPVTIDGSLCMISPTGKLSIKNVDQLAQNGLQNKFNVKGGVKFLNTSNDVIEGCASTSNINAYKNMILGGVDHKVYVPASQKNDGNDFSINSVKSFISYASVGSATDVSCDTSIVDYCKNKLGTEGASGCDGSRYKINDVLTTAYQEFKSYAETKHTPCSDITVSDSSNQVGTLNACYTSALANSQLFHGFLVVKINNSAINIFTNPGDSLLNGNFIFYADEKIEHDLNFPPMADSSFNAFVYLAGGAEKINTTSVVGPRNYFFYSERDINLLQHGVVDSTQRTWDGSFYMKVGTNTCAKINDLNTTNQYLKYNAPLVQILLDSAIICDISEEGTCGVSSGSGNPNYNPAGEDEVDGFDIHYVATSPQLSISLESQHRDNLFTEPVNVTKIGPSVVVLPRAAYLNRKPKGTLFDYFSVINLNGAQEKRTAAKTQCSDLLKGQSADEAILPDSTSSLDPGVYNCSYQADAQYALSGNKGLYNFWVVIDGEMDDITKIHFRNSNSRVRAGGEVPVNVELVAEGSVPVSVTIKVTEAPDEWTVTHLSGVTKVNEETYTLTMDPGDTKTIFRVNAAANAEKGQMIFTIESVGSNGLITSPNVHTVSLTGDGRIKRENIPSDCGDVESIKSENSETELSCSEIAKLEDCTGDLLKGIKDEWIRPNCNKPVTLDPNNLWECSFSGESGISLVKGNYLSEYCDLFILPESVQNPEDGKEYTLHASYKAKMHKIVVKLESEHSEVQVRESKTPVLKKEDWWNISPIGTCEYSSSEETCTYYVPTGYHMSFYADAKGGEVFKNWIITGVKDPSTLNPYDELLVASDTTITAIFGENGDHCFESSFDNTGVWCDDNRNPKNADDCIDKCDYAKSNGNDGNSQCFTRGGGTSASNGSRASSYWLVPRTNSGQNFCPPQLQNGFLNYTTPHGNSCSDFDGSGNGKKNAESGNATITYLLNRAEAGHNGKMTAVFKTCVDDKIYNSGFIVRSPANIGTKDSDWYTVYNILGVESNNEYKMFVRKCYGDGTGIKNNNTCESEYYLKENRTKALTVPKDKFANTLFSATIEVIGDVAKVVVSYTDNKNVVHVGSVEISETDEGRDGYGKESSDLFVGASLAANCFKVHSIKWEAYDWGGCGSEDARQVSCSFSAGYLGGMLPIAEEVAPWVGTSSWFKDPANPFKLKDECKISYHYNGCDIDPDNANFGSCSVWEDGKRHCSQCSADKDGPYYVSGVSALPVDKYVFTQAGAHGSVPKTYQYSGTIYNGTVRDASVVVDCGGSDVYTATCGSFNVGTLSMCNQNFEFIVRDCDGSKSVCTANAPSGYVNLRSASLIGEISMPDGSPNPDLSLLVYLRDDAGNLSQEIRINGTGPFWSDVNLHSDKSDFNPERVTSILFSSSDKFVLNSLRSDCPNSIGIYGCNANYDGQAIVITTNMQNPQNAKCKVVGEGNGFKVDEAACPTNGVFEIPANLQSEVNASGDESRDYVFTVSMMSNDNEEFVETCTTPPMTKNSNVMKCEFNNGLDNINVIPGDELPTLTYTISNCPTGGCQVSASVNGSSPTILDYSGGLGEWAPMDTVVAGQNYTYELSYLGKTCRATLNVLTPSGESMASNCRITNDGFSAELNLEETSDLKIEIFDRLGVSLKNYIIEQKGVNTTTKLFTHSLPNITNPGSYNATLVVNGVNACSFGEFTVGGSAELPSDLKCDIVNGNFVTGVKNNTSADIPIQLNCSAGYDEGNPISGARYWARNGFVSIEIYEREDCDNYILMTSDNKKLCEKKLVHSASSSGDEPSTEESSSSAESSFSSEKSSSSVSSSSAKSSSSETPKPAASCEIDGGATSGAVGTTYTFKVSGIQGVPNGSSLTVAGQSKSYNGNDVTVTISASRAGSETYEALYSGISLCSKEFTWEKPKPSAECEPKLSYKKGGTKGGVTVSNVQNVSGKVTIEIGSCSKTQECSSGCSYSWNGNEDCGTTQSWRVTTSDGTELCSGEY